MLSAKAEKRTMALRAMVLLMVASVVVSAANDDGGVVCGVDVGEVMQ